MQCEACNRKDPIVVVLVVMAGNENLLTNPLLINLSIEPIDTVLCIKM